MLKKLMLLIILILALTACAPDDAHVASYNLSRAADMFEVDRRVVFYNGITGDYILVVEGKCSIEADTLDNQLELTCKTGPDVYKKHFLGLSDNVTYFAEQMESVGVSTYHYRVIFKPSAIIPDIEVR